MNSEEIAPFVGRWSGEWENTVKTKHGMITLVITPDGKISGDTSQEGGRSRTAVTQYGKITEGELTSLTALYFRYKIGSVERDSASSYSLSTTGNLVIEYTDKEDGREYDRGKMELRKRR